MEFKDILNKVICCDCLEGMRQLPDESVDLVLTDPPYNTGMSESKRSGSTRLNHFFNDDLPADEYALLVSSVCGELFRILKNNSAAYVFISWKSCGIWLENMAGVGFKVKNCIVWDKVIHGLNYVNYAYTHEFILFATKGDFFPKNKPGEYWRDIWHIQRRIDNEQESLHETVKAIEIVRIPIVHSTTRGGVVLDPFMGTGTTAVACKQLGRNFIGFEISPEYCKIAEKRLQQETLFSSLQNQRQLKEEVM